MQGKMSIQDVTGREMMMENNKNYFIRAAGISR
jgi:hypothetical protein